MLLGKSRVEMLDETLPWLHLLLETHFVEHKRNLAVDLNHVALAVSAGMGGKENLETLNKRIRELMGKAKPESDKSQTRRSLARIKKGLMHGN